MGLWLEHSAFVRANGRQSGREGSLSSLNDDDGIEHRIQHPCKSLAVVCEANAGFVQDPLQQGQKILRVNSALLTRESRIQVTLRAIRVGEGPRKSTLCVPDLEACPGGYIPRRRKYFLVFVKAHSLGFCAKARYGRLFEPLRSPTERVDWRVERAITCSPTHSQSGES